MEFFLDEMCLKVLLNNKTQMLFLKMIWNLVCYILCTCRPFVKIKKEFSCVLFEQNMAKKKTCQSLDLRKNKYKHDKFNLSSNTIACVKWLARALPSLLGDQSSNFNINDHIYGIHEVNWILQDFCLISSH